MYIAYTDESGDSGYTNSPTSHLVISCLLINEWHWLETLNKLVSLRQELKRDYGIPTRSELKSEHFIYNRGPFKKLTMKRHERMKLYEKLLDYETNNLNLRIFAVAIAKENIKYKGQIDPRATAWQYLMQRLDNFCEKQEPKERVILFPDEGHGPLVKTIMRKIRRYQTVKGFYGGELDIKARHLIEDPHDKNSQSSYFIQLADLNSYAAHRYKEIAPNRKVPDYLWDRLDKALLKEVNERTGGPKGIVLWPRS